MPSVRGFRFQRVVGRALLYLIAVGSAVVFMIPFAWTVLSSLKTPGELFLYPPTWFPARPQPQNYAEVFSLVPFSMWTGNTMIVALTSTFGAVLSSAVVGYSFARFRFPGRDMIFMITLSTMMLPIEVTLIPLYLLFSKIHWLDSFKPLIVPSFFGGGAFLIFLMRQFIMTIPKDLDEAARIDGAGYLRIFWQIILPLSVPALATAAILTFMGNWNEFLQPFIFLNDKNKYTLAIGIRYFQAVASQVDSMEHREHLLMAASVMMTAPIIVLFFVAQRYFVRGIVMSGIKG
ncbi:MAG: carbohydrate ABC transporter permease [Caldilineaceae bacterium]|nr:carbohydrate ABC transporter permease [Caldilineaceae bacterium]